MKKILNTLVAVALSAATMTSLTACGGGDNDEPDDPHGPSTEKTLKKADVDLKFYVNKEMLDTYQIEATTATGAALTFSKSPVDMTLADGKVVAMYPIEAEAESTSLPVSAGIKLKYTIKEGYSLPEKSYLAIAWEGDGDVTYVEGGSNDYSASRLTKSYTVKQADMEKFTDMLNSSYSNFTATLSAEGFEVTHSRE